MAQQTDLKADLYELRLRNGAKHSDVMLTFTGLVALGENDFEAVNTIGSPEYFTRALDVECIPCAATLRQRMDERAQEFISVLAKAKRDFLVRSRPSLARVARRCRARYRRHALGPQ